jgi:hypothetical protein
MRHLFIYLTFIFILILVGCTSVPLVGVQLNDGNDIITVGSLHIDAGCVYGDGISVYTMNITSNTVNIHVLGEYSIDYSFFHDGVTHTCKRIVKVVDNIPPTARLKPGVDTIYVGEQHIDTGITANDNYDDDLTIEVINQVDVNNPGTYEIIYVVTDHSGNKTLITRIVTVLSPTYN